MIYIYIYYKKNKKPNYNIRMGVEKLHGILHKIYDPENKIKHNISYLYLDANSFIHAIFAIHEDNINLSLCDLIDQIKNKDDIDKFEPEIKDQMVNIIERENDNLIENGMKYIDNFVKKYSSDDTKKIHIVFDSIPEYAKCIHKKRRNRIDYVIDEINSVLFEKYHDDIYFRKQVYEKYKYNVKHRNLIFYDILGRMITALNNKYKDNNKMNIIGNDGYGEAEKKIISIIYNEDNYDEDDGILIASPDNDMIVLACILMHKLHMNKKQVYVYILSKHIFNIYELGEKIIDHYLSSIIEDNDKPKYNVISMLKDLAFILTMYGNDFLPRILTMDLDKNFQEIISIYFRNKLENIVIYEDDVYKVNDEKFSKIFKILNDNEDLWYSDLNKEMMNDGAYSEVKLKNIKSYIIGDMYHLYYLNKYTSINNIEKMRYYLNGYDFNVEKQIVSYLKKYLDKHDYSRIIFNNKKHIWRLLLNDYDYDDDNKSQMNKNDDNMSKEYLDGLFWNFDYYYKRIFNDEGKISVWFYKYKYPPYIKEMYNYITKTNYLNNKNDANSDKYFVNKEDYLTRNEYEQSFFVDDEKESIKKKYIDNLLKSYFDCYTIDRKNNEIIFEREMTKLKTCIKGLKQTLQDGINCRYILYLNRCDVGLEIDDYETFIKKVRNK
jgi:hypothetical protein